MDMEIITEIIKACYNNKEELIHAAKILQENGFIPVKSPLWTDGLFCTYIAWIRPEHRDKPVCIYFCSNHYHIEVLVHDDVREEALKNIDTEFEELWHFSDYLYWLSSPPMDVHKAIELYDKIINNIS